MKGNSQGQRVTFEITHIHVLGLRGLHSLTLPDEGLGWEKRFPPVAILGGANGSGKTTLLCCLARAARLLVSPSAAVPEEVAASEIRLDFLISDGHGEPLTIRFLIGDNKFIEQNTSEHCYGYVFAGARPRSLQRGAVADLRKTLQSPKRFARSTWPRLVFLPSEERDLVVPRVKYKAPGSLEDNHGFVVWWERPNEKHWSGSTLELLFSARWADLNAKEEGKPEEARHFDSFTQAFGDLTGQSKRLGWTTRGDLVVELDGGGTHPVQDLSSGERQALLLLAELRRCWRPGSLVLIDELELHLHDAWQGRLYEALQSMQAELGGQVLVTTQSHALFEMAEIGTRALLGRGDMR